MKSQKKVVGGRPLFVKEGRMVPLVTKSWDEKPGL